jgi:hypothetical protein
MPQSPKRRSTSPQHRARVTEARSAPSRQTTRPRRVTIVAWVIVLTFGLAAVLPAVMLLFG